MITALIALFLLAAVVFWLQRRPNHDSSLPLPPGPPPVSIIGNIFDLTANELWVTATEWSKKYGTTATDSQTGSDVIYLHVFGLGLVFLSSPEATRDLLEKKGSIYSDKPSLTMVGELCGCENMVAFTRYGDQSKRQRRLMNTAFASSAIPAYHPLIESQTKRFLSNLITKPQDYMRLSRSYAGSLTLSVVYGYSPSTASIPNPSFPISSSSPEDPLGFLSLAEECVDLLANRMASGGGIWPVDIFPSLRHCPEWFLDTLESVVNAPAALLSVIFMKKIGKRLELNFLRNARIWKAKMEEFVDRPYAWVKESIKSGTNIPSFCSTLFENMDPNTVPDSTKTITDREDNKTMDQYEFDLKWTANSMYGASMDTTITFVAHFILSMIQNPDKLKKAQKEIDSVTGGGRLPTFADRPELKYVEALLNETYRISAPVPLSLPHRLEEDDVYRGMRIPKGSFIFGNIWAIVRDPTLFPNPDSFEPERFMYDDSVDDSYKRRRDPKEYVFGFGRRRCPGASLVESSIWFLIVSMIATLDISKFKDAAGKEEDVEVKYENSVFRNPTPFKCDIRPRSAQALQLIRDSEML